MRHGNYCVGVAVAIAVSGLLPLQAEIPFVDNVATPADGSYAFSESGRLLATQIRGSVIPREILGVRIPLVKSGTVPVGLRVTLREDASDPFNNLFEPGEVLIDFGIFVNDDPEGPFVVEAEIPGGTGRTFSSYQGTFWICVESTQGSFEWPFATTAEQKPAFGRLEFVRRESNDAGSTWAEPAGGRVAQLIGVDVIPLPVGVEHIVDDPVDGNPGSLRAVVAAASAGDTIRFAPGLSGATIRLTGGSILVDKDLTIDGSGLGQRIVLSGDKTGDGKTADDTRIFVLDGGIEVALDSLVIADGYPPQPQSWQAIRGGGGIESEAGLTMRNCVVRNCATRTSPDQRNSGAGLRQTGPYFIMQDCAVIGNEAGDASPLGSNNAGRGGGIYCNGLYVGGVIHLERCTFANNRCGIGSLGGSGGGINASGYVRLEQCTVSGNRAGDGVSADPGEGGGIYVGSGLLHLISSTVTDNEVGTGGSGFGGGFSVLSGGATLENSIVADNRNLGDPVRGRDVSILNPDELVMIGRNLVGEQNLAELDALEPGLPNVFGVFVGPFGSPISADLLPLASNGGPGPTHVPREGSLAIDPEGGDTDSGFTTDQRGGPRIVKGGARHRCSRGSRLCCHPGDQERPAHAEAAADQSNPKSVPQRESRSSQRPEGF